MSQPSHLSLEKLPTKNLESFSKGPTLCVQQKPTPTSMAEVIYSSYPKAVLIQFSSKYAAMFPPINKLSVSQLHKAQPTTITIICGDLNSVKAILAWMLSCCTANGWKSFQYIPRSEKPLFRYHMFKEVAVDMGIDYLVKELGDRMDKLVERQVHSEDVRAIWLALPDNHELKQFLAQHVANRIWNHELKAFAAYATLRDELPSFDDALNVILDPLSAARRKERHERYLKQRDERQGANHAYRNSGKDTAEGSEKEAKPEEFNVETKTKKVVPGADDLSQVPFFVNKAAKKRQKKRSQNAAEAAG